MNSIDTRVCLDLGKLCHEINQNNVAPRIAVSVNDFLEYVMSSICSKSADCYSMEFTRYAVMFGKYGQQHVGVVLVSVLLKRDSPG